MKSSKLSRLATVQNLIKRIGFSTLLAFVYTSNQACIHVKSHERAAVHLPDEQGENQGVEMQKGDGFEIISILYRPSKLPLSDFFARMRKGEFQEAFRKIDLNYKQSNANDKAIIELVAHGYIPAYVQFKNTGSSSISFDEKNFSIVSESDQVKAFYADQLPYEFKSFNPTAAAANVYNIGVVTVGFFAVVLAMAIVSTSAKGSADFPNLKGLNIGPVLNETDRTMNIEYKDFLIHNTQLNSRGTSKGLLFFKVDSLTGIHNYKLIFRPNSEKKEK
ncbi:MAG: hypothetical protein JNM39_17510 [Bdellovibrionaceae bacterium]|nr:hypothetical protein [Pseudobdellovibrionaceae bacterium]